MPGPEHGRTTAYARAEDGDEIAATSRSTSVRLLSGFDQYVLGPGTWEATDGVVEAALFDEGVLPGLEAEVERLGHCLGRELELLTRA